VQYRISISSNYKERIIAINENVLEHINHLHTVMSETFSQMKEYTSKYHFSPVVAFSHGADF
jgi:hypothetical protein